MGAVVSNEDLTVQHYRRLPIFSSRSIILDKLDLDLDLDVDLYLYLVLVDLNLELD